MDMTDDIREYSIDDLSGFLEAKGIGEDVLAALRENRVGGEVFLELTESDVRELVKPLGERKALLKIINIYKPEAASTISMPLAKPTLTETVSRNWAQNFEIPHQFSRRTMHGIEKGEITRCCRTEIITALAFQIYTNHTRYPTSEEYTAVCSNLVRRHPILKDTIGNGIGSWKLQLRQKLKNMRRDPAKRAREECDGDKENENPDGSQAENPAKKTTQRRRSQRVGSSVGEDVASNGDYETNVQCLSEELEKEKPSRKTVRKLMKETFAGRRHWVLSDSPPVTEVVKVFPPIKRVKYLHRELEAIAHSEVEVELSNASDAWLAFEPKIQQLSSLEARNSSKLQELLTVQKSEAETLASDDSGEAATSKVLSLHALEQLSFLLAPKRKMQLVHRFPMHCDLDKQVKTVAQNFPYLAVLVGDSSLQFFLVVERLALDDCEEFIDAVTALIGAYFAFNIEYPRPFSPLLIFLQHFVLKLRDSQAIPPTVTRLISSLDALQ